MTASRKSILLASSAPPLPSFSVNSIDGLAPAFTDALSSVYTRPFNCLDLAGMVCAPTTDASNSLPLSAAWHVLQPLSSFCAPAGWSFTPGYSALPVAQSMPSWHEPHAARLGTFFQ